MVIPNIDEIVILACLLVVPLLFVVVNLGIVEVSKVSLLLLNGFEIGLIFRSFLFAIVQGYEVPH